MPINYKNPIKTRDLRNGDWFWVNKQVWQNKELTQSDKVVYGTLAFFANNNTQESFPSIETLARFSSISKRQTYRSIKNLEERKFIRIKRHKIKGRPNEYLLLKIKGDNSAPKKNRVTKCHKKGDKLSQNRVTNNTSNNTNTNNTNNNKIITSNGKAITGKEFNDLLYLFKPLNPSYERLFPNKSQRASLERLVEKHGIKKITKVIKCLPEIINKPYSPRITTPYQLEQKLGDLIVFLNQEKMKGGSAVDAR